MSADRDGPCNQRPVQSVQYLPIRTLDIDGGGLELLLPATLPVGASVLVHLDQGDPVSARVVWVGPATPTVQGTRFAHGVAFEQPVDPDLVSQWGVQPEQRVHERVSVRFDVEYTHAGRTSHGMGLNLSQKGMFIATERPLSSGTQLLLHFIPPGLSNPLSIRARVAWMYTDEGEPSAMPGMGVQFLVYTLTPSKMPR